MTQETEISIDGERYVQTNSSSIEEATERHRDMTQKYSTWGDKLLQHTDVLYSIQYEKKFKPITIQLAPTENCSSDCPFCSVAGRPLKSYMPFPVIEQVLSDFKYLGAKSLELTGGGSSLLYRDKENKKNINDIIQLAADLKYEIGIIDNNHTFKLVNKELYPLIKWWRVSLIQLDEGKNPEDYNFNGFPYEKLGFSYIIYDSTGGVPDELSRTKKSYKGTGVETIQKIAKLIELHPKIKFVRIAGNCLIKGNNAATREKYKDIIAKIDKHRKFFIKDIGYDDSPFNEGCYVGLIRPYVAPNPHGGNYQVYICTSHVLNTRTYDLDYSLCNVEDIIKTWDGLNKHFEKHGVPYEVKGNKGADWESTCKFCYYKNNNKLLHTVAQPMPDKNFP